jgi:heme/copper-type cytochrome/quinol oxidase subunit 2
MKSKLLLSQDHPSYQLHRKQMWTQILLPILLTVLVFIAVIVLTSIATFRDNGDVGRWAAISTIWLVMPVMIVGLIF